MSYASNFCGYIFSFIFIVFALCVLGYLLGAIKIKGVGLGTAGCLITSLLWGILIHYFPNFTVDGVQIDLWSTSIKNNYTLLSNLGTALFVTAVGLTSGPKFFRSFNKKTLAYILLGVIIIIIAAIISVIIMAIDKSVKADLAMGLLTGALTSTPGLSAAKEEAKDQDSVVAGYGIAYIFGVVCVVLFVQIVPKILKVNMQEEVSNFKAANAIEIPTIEGADFNVDKQGFFPFFFSIAIGCLIGTITIPKINFKLGNSGGCLIGGLIIGHFGRMGKLNCRISKEGLVFFRELGLVIFLIGAGVPGGVNFISKFKALYFLYGILFNLIPMTIGFVISKFGFKLSILNNLGAITGGMTSTPALGALISSAGTDEVTSAYAATYPFALVAKVIVVKVIIKIYD